MKYVQRQAEKLGFELKPMLSVS